MVTKGGVHCIEPESWGAMSHVNNLRSLLISLEERTGGETVTIADLLNAAQTANSQRAAGLELN